MNVSGKYGVSPGVQCSPAFYLRVGHVSLTVIREINEGFYPEHLKGREQLEALRVGFTIILKKCIRRNTV